MDKSIFYEGIKCLYNRDFSKIIKYTYDHTVDNSNSISSDVSIPSWIEQSSSPLLATPDVGEEPYYNILSGAAKTEITPPNDFDSIDLGLYQKTGLDDFIVEISYNSSSGEENKKSFNFVSGNSSQAYMPIAIDLEESTEKAQITAFSKGKSESDNSLSLGVPSPNYKSATPIFFFSIDSLPFYCRDLMKPLIDTVDNGVVPEEPRTQGTWTPSSHASMFTGFHPADHHYVNSNLLENNRPINSSLTTLPEVLMENQYKCSAIVSHSALRPKYGFGRGFHRYHTKEMSDWLNRKNDARDNINELIKWVDEDTMSGSKNLFYFTHLFDPHFPYLPPLPDDEIENVDLELIKEYDEWYHSWGDSIHPVGPLSDGEKIDPSTFEKRREKFGIERIEQIKQYYKRSVEYTANQLDRFIEHLKHKDIYQESYIIITGDHGEEFCERAYGTHGSLYDQNIRPFMLIKPPEGETWDIPDEVDTIDLFPTIAKSINADISPNVQGIPLQEKEKSTQRITERLAADLPCFAA
ncbi:sulfatase-like hydrolase/transferase [Halorubrum pallidum]|uniref:Sulfatase-like hydrolase/transferase n=1 Tax=Halorubrum pallidum TaxID=1526114 RepID=A0ABD5T3C3_9EURY